MGCRHCTEAEAAPLSAGRYSFNTCLSCNARALAISPVAGLAVGGDEKAAEQLRKRIKVVWQADYTTGRAAVWAWLKAIKASKAQQ